MAGGTPAQPAVSVQHSDLSQGHGHLVRAGAPRTLGVFNPDSVWSEERQNWTKSALNALQCPQFSGNVPECREVRGQMASQGPSQLCVPQAQLPTDTVDEEDTWASTEVPGPLSVLGASP